jgi:hypothetical protein
MIDAGRNVRQYFLDQFADQAAELLDLLSDMSRSAHDIRPKPEEDEDLQRLHLLGLALQLLMTTCTPNLRVAVGVLCGIAELGHDEDTPH